jgi:hypothetical protein
LNEIKLFIEKKGRNIEEFNDEEWITDLAFFVDVSGHLKNLNKELQYKDKFSTDMYDNIEAFKVKLRLWENQLKLHNIVVLSSSNILQSHFAFIRHYSV